MKNKLQPTRTSFSQNFQCKKASRWLSKFFSFWYRKWGGTVKKSTLYIAQNSCYMINIFWTRISGCIHSQRHHFLLQQYYILNSTGSLKKASIALQELHSYSQELGRSIFQSLRRESVSEGSVTPGQISTF